MPSRKSASAPNQTSLMVGGTLTIIAFVFVIVYFRQIAPGNSPLIMQTQGSLNVSVRIIETICKDAKEIDFSEVELSIDGGAPPYDLTIANSNLQLDGPYAIPTNNFPVHIKIYGGDHFTATVRSQIGEFWSGTIGLPLETRFCKNAVIPTLWPADITVVIPDTAVPPTEIYTMTLMPSNTETISQSPTTTLVFVDQTHPAATDTRNPKPGKTSTISFPSSTAMSSNQPSKTPDPQSTDTNPKATDTHQLQPPDTPRPQPTEPPAPEPTKTSAPPPTVIIPNPKECEDGIDNDGDTLIDYPNDPQCTRSGDPHED
jgi:hypothetical protein